MVGSIHKLESLVREGLADRQGSSQVLTIQPDLAGNGCSLLQREWGARLWTM